MIQQDGSAMLDLTPCVRCDTVTSIMLMRLLMHLLLLPFLVLRRLVLAMEKREQMSDRSYLNGTVQGCPKGMEAAKGLSKS
jgi:hypothetical protein